MEGASEITGGIDGIETHSYSDGIPTNVTGGTVNGTTTIANGVANVSGGTFNGDFVNTGNTADTGVTTITGGKFTPSYTPDGDEPDPIPYEFNVSGGNVVIKSPEAVDDETPVVAPTIDRDITVSSSGNLTVENGTVNGTVTKAADASGGGVIVPKTYDVTVPGTIPNGTITADKDKAEADKTVTITVKPNEGMSLDTLTVLDKNGKEVTLTDLGNDKYSFKMPKSEVTVKATFVEDEVVVPTKTVEDADTASVFNDVEATDYYAAAVKWAKDNGVTDGTSATTFSPDDDCTRAQVVTFLYRWMVK